MYQKDTKLATPWQLLVGVDSIHRQEVLDSLLKCVELDALKVSNLYSLLEEAVRQVCALVFICACEHRYECTAISL